jgi:hypothetical protein
MKLMREKLPALLSLLAILIALPASVYLIKRETRYNSQAYDENSIFGVTHERALTPEIVEAMSQAGIKWSRVFFNWSKIEPEKWQFDFAETDKDLNLYLNQDIQPYAVLYKTPSWAEIGHIPYSGKCSGTNYAPLGWEWRHFVKQIVGRYGCGQGGKCQIHHWEIYYEENGCFFLDKNNSANVNEYLKILKIANEEIKKIDPQAKLVLGRILPDVGYLNYFRDLKRAGGGQYFEIVSFGGPYGCGKNQQLKARIDEVRNLFSNKEIWATEVVCESSYNFDGDEEKCEPDPKGEAIQAQQLRDWYQIAQNKKISKLFWQSYSDRINMPKPNKRCTGLVRHDYTPKEAYFAYQQIATANLSPTASPTPSPVLPPSPLPSPSVSPSPSLTPSGGSGKITGNVWLDNNGNGKQFADNEAVYTCSGTESQKIKLELYEYQNPDTPVQVSELTDGNFYQFINLKANRYRIKIAQAPICNGKQYSPTQWRLVNSPSANSSTNISPYCNSSYWGTCLDQGEAPSTQRWWPLEVFENETTKVYLGIRPQ